MSKIYLLTLLLFISCENQTKNKKQLFKGELFIKLVGITHKNFYSVENKDGTTLANKLDTMAISNIQDSSTLEIKIHYELLKKNELLEKSSFMFINKLNKEKKTVYISTEEFEKVNRYKLSELKRRNKKVAIEFYGEQISDYELICDELKSVKLVRGKTEWEK